MRPRFTRLSMLLGASSLFLAIFASAQQTPVKPLIVRPVDETKLTLLKGNTHPMARPEFDRGAAPASLPMERMLLVLKRSPEQESALRKLLDNQQDKSSPSYHKWLTPEQFGKQFGPADQDIKVITLWLQSHGFKIAQVAKGRTMIEFSGTAGKVQGAFHTAIHKYAVEGKEYWANADDQQIPEALAPAVGGVLTLHNFYKQPQIKISDKPVPAIFKPGPPPQVTFTDGSHALSPGDYAVIYNITPVYQSGIFGATSSIAVVARSNINLQDVADFDSLLAVPPPGIFTILNGPDPGNLGGGEEGEAMLDVTWSSSIANGATLDFVISASTNTTDGVDLSELYIVDNNVADVMTESFGSCEAVFTSAELDGVSAVAEQAAAQGITYMVSSGDNGAAGCDDPNSATGTALAVSGLASTPFNIAVGGTSFNDIGHDSTYWSPNNSAIDLSSALSYIPENVWNESGPGLGLWSSSGGPSAFFPKPSWQTGVAGIPADGFRDLPDVSLTAAIHDPYMLCLEASCVPDAQNNIAVFLVGGTSASTPAFAGIMALVDQQTVSRQGQANYVLYPMAAAETLSQCNGSKTTGLPASTCVFNDVTVGNNNVPGLTGFSSTVGYDLATGLGSVNVANLVNNWPAPGTATTTTLAPLIGTTHGAPVSVDITVAPTSGTGTPTGDVTLLTNLGQSVGLFSLNSGAVSSSTNLLPGGTYAVRAHYGGDGTFAAGDSVQVGVTVLPEPSTTTLTALLVDSSGNVIPFATATAADLIYVRADVAGQSNFGIPTGTVDITEGGTSIFGSPYTLNIQGNTATPNGISFAAGAHTLIANYGSDASFNASTSSAVNFTITDFTFAGSAPTVTIASAGGSGSLTLTVTALSGFNGTIYFTSASCAGLPALTTCSFNPASITGSGATTLTIATTAPHSARLEGFGWWTTGLSTTLAGVFLIGASPKRRRWGVLFSLLFCVFLASGVGCGGGSSGPASSGGTSPGTPVGQSVVTVTGSASGTPLAHAVTFTLNVQ